MGQARAWGVGFRIETLDVASKGLSLLDLTCQPSTLSVRSCFCFVYMSLLSSRRAEFERRVEIG